MLNQAAVEALCSATYLENYLDCMENLPDDLQRSVSLLRELDSKTCDHLRDISHHQDVYKNEIEPKLRKQSLVQIQRGLVKCQEIGDEKLQIVSHIMEFVEGRSRQLEQDLENLDPSTALSRGENDLIPVQKTITNTVKQNRNTLAAGVTAMAAAPRAAPAPMPIVPREQEEERPEKLTGKRQRRQRMNKEEEKKEDKEKPKKKKKRKAKKVNEGAHSPHLEPIDPDEPTYCSCQQVSYGEMIGCDNDDCPIEWYHFNCVGLSTKPKGKWYCPECRGDKPTVRRQDK